MASEKLKTPVLGHGLESLLGSFSRNETTAIDGVDTIQEVSLESIKPGKYQPRRNFIEEDLSDLILSIQEKGLLQPILVRFTDDDNNPESYEIIAGERRWRACKLAGLTSIPVLIKSFSDHEALEAALIENIQRENLSPIEEAEGYQKLCKDFHYTQDQISKSIGKSRSHVANTIRLLDLPKSVQELVIQRKLSYGHARALITSDHSEHLANYILANNLSVRQTEALVKQGTLKKSPQTSLNKLPLDPPSHLKPLDLDKEQHLPEHQKADWSHLATLLQESLELPVEFRQKESTIYLLIQLNSMEKFDQFLQKVTSLSTSP